MAQVAAIVIFTGGPYCGRVSRSVHIRTSTALRHLPLRDLHLLVVIYGARSRSSTRYVQQYRAVYKASPRFGSQCSAHNSINIRRFSNTSVLR
jgi:hypothetical protein